MTDVVYHTRVISLEVQNNEYFYLFFHHPFMMGFYNGGWGMGLGAGPLGLFTWLVVFIDLVLLGMWLWKNISKK